MSSEVAKCGKPARHGAPCSLDINHALRGERHSNGEFTWALRGQEAKQAEANTLAPFVPPSTKKQPRCSSGYGVAGQCQLFANHLGDHFACVPSPSGFEVQMWTDAGDAESWAVCGVRKQLEYNGDKPEPKQIRDPKERILCLRRAGHTGDHIGLDNIGNHTCEWKDGNPASVHSPKYRIDFVRALLGQKFEYRWDEGEGEDEDPAEPAENLKPCPSEDARGFACSKVAGHDGKHHNVRGWKPRALEMSPDRTCGDGGASGYCQLHIGHAGEHLRLDGTRVFTWTKDAEAHDWVICGTASKDRKHRCMRPHAHDQDHVALTVTESGTSEVVEIVRWDHGAPPKILGASQIAKCLMTFTELDGPTDAPPADSDDADELFNADNTDRWWWGWRGQTGIIVTKKYSGDMAPVTEARSHPFIGRSVIGPFLLDVGEGEEQAERRIRNSLEAIDSNASALGYVTESADDKEPSAAPCGEETTRTMEAIDYIRHDRIEPDPDQPRKTFDPIKLDELAASITEHGVQVPISVRPKPQKPGYYIINWGERRWRATGIAGIDTVPCIVDVDAGEDPAKLLERQLLENNHDELTPLEEGEALARLHTKHGKSIDDLMAKVGKSRSHVYARIKLTELATGVKKAMLDGRLPHAHGELIGRIPDHKLQEQCCKEVLGEISDKVFSELEDLGVSHEAVNEKEERRIYRMDGKRQILSFRSTAALVRRRYQTRLALATFDPADATLVPAGACGPCPHRSGNQPELPGVSAPVKGEDYCTNLPCFEKKTAAQWKRVADAARAEGKKVFEGKKAAEMFYANRELKSDSGFAAPDQKLPYDVVHTYDNKLTYKKLLGKHIAEVPTAIVQDERGAPIEVLDQKKALEVLREHKLLPKKGASSGTRHGSQTEAEKKAAAQRKKERETEKLREEAFPFLLTQAVGAAKSLPETKAAALWRLVALFVREHLDYAAGELYRSLYDDNETHDHIGERLEKLKSESDLRGLVVELLLIQAADDITSGGGQTDEAMELATKLLGLDWKKAEKYALEKRALEKKTEAAEKATAAKKKGGRK